MKTKLPAPGTTVASLLAGITPGQLSTLNQFNLGTASEHDIVHGPLPEDALRFLYLRMQVRQEANELIEEINTANQAHKLRHQRRDFKDEECVAHQESLKPKEAELEILKSYLETLSNMMWAIIRLHYSIHSEQKGVLMILNGPEGLIAVQQPKEKMPFDIEIIDVGIGFPIDGPIPGFPGFPGRSRPKAPTSAS